MASSSSSSSSRTWKYDVFPSFRGEDVRKTFLSHLVKELKSKSINTFIDNGIERSHLIADELLSAIRESRISIVVLSKNYVSSTWCLNELAEIHECFREMNQMVIPVFYELDPSHVKKQTGEFGKTFDETCQGKTEDQKQRWVRALAEIATIAGYDSRNWTDDSKMIEEISKDVLKKLLSTPSDDFHDFVGIGDHIEAIMDSKLCLESGGVRMVGIWGPSGIGKSTIASALFHRLSTQFDHRAFASYKRAIENRKVPDVNVKLAWAQQFLSKILGQKNIKIQSLGMMEQRLKHMKVLIVLDDVDEIELLETLVGQPGWFGFGSRIIVVTQDRALLESHGIDIVYEVEFPSEDLALQMFCQSAFGQTFPPDGFMELAAEVTNLSGNLPLGLNVLGSSLRKKKKEYWEEMMPRFRNGLNGKIEKTLRVSYDGLDEKDDQDIFLHIACLFNGESVSSVKNLLEKSCYTSVNTSLRTLAEKSLVRITTQDEIVQMHILLEKLGREIVRSESINNPGKRRFLVDLKDISDVFENNSGTKNVLGIRLGTSEINEPLFIDDKSFEGMRNLQFINFFKEWWPPHKTGEVRFCLPHQGLIYFPRKLRLLHWDEYPAKYIPSNFKAEHLVELIMIDSKLEKLWEGAQPFRSLEVMDISGSKDLKEIPDFSNATNLEILIFSGCTSLVTLPSSIRNLKKLIDLSMERCSKLEILPTDVNLESLDYLDLRGCSKLRSFPQLSTSIEYLNLGDTAIEEVPSWIENIVGLTYLEMTGCEKLKEISANIWNLKHLKWVNFTHCGGVTSVSDTSLVKTVAELHEEMYLSCSDSDTELLFYNCFNLDQDAQKFILQSNFKYAILPGKKVPTYFTHRAPGSSLTVRLPQSSLSQNHLRFTAYIIPNPNLMIHYSYKKIIVHWKFRAVEGAHEFSLAMATAKMDHLGVFQFNIFFQEDPPSQLDCENVEFEFKYHYSSDLGFETSSLLPIKECGVRVLDVFEESGRSKKRMRMTVEPSQVHSNLPGDKTAVNSGSMAPCVEEEARSSEESGRSKKRMRMTVTTSQEPSNSLCGQTAVNSGSMAPNLEVSLGLVGASPHVSSRSKVPSPSNSSRNFHGAGDGPSLNLSLSPYDPCLDEEASYVDPIITEQQDSDTWIPSEDTSSSPQLINFFR